VIWESGYWKENLLRQSLMLRKKQQQRRWTERSFALLEQVVMLGFYSIRKLAEAHKISDEIVRLSVPLMAFPWKGKPVTSMNWHRLTELYDMGLGKPVKRSLLFLCHQVVHSYIFSPLFEDKYLAGVFFSSDRQRHKSLYLIKTNNIVTLFDLVANNDPGSLESVYDFEKQDYDTVVGPGINSDGSRQRIPPLEHWGPWP